VFPDTIVALLPGRFGHHAYTVSVNLLSFLTVEKPRQQ
jgi:hypothetical protein